MNVRAIPSGSPSIRTDQPAKLGVVLDNRLKSHVLRMRREHNYLPLSRLDGWHGNGRNIGSSLLFNATSDTSAF
jgi:hypothetical protein